MDKVKCYNPYCDNMVDFRNISTTKKRRCKSCDWSFRQGYRNGHATGRNRIENDKRKEMMKE